MKSDYIRYQLSIILLNVCLQKLNLKPLFSIFLFVCFWTGAIGRLENNLGIYFETFPILLPWDILLVYHFLFISLGKFPPLYPCQFCGRKPKCDTYLTRDLSLLTLLQVWSLNQKHGHHQETSKKCRLSGSTRTTILESTIQQDLPGDFVYIK